MAEIKNCINRMNRIDMIKPVGKGRVAFHPVNPVHPVN
jgi:hypothetical protein